MALTDEGNGGIGATMLVGPTGYGAGYPMMPMYGGGMGGFGGGGDWWGILLLIALLNGGFGGFGGFGGGGLGYDFPWLLNGQQNVMANTNNGFRDQMINDNVTSIRDGVSNLATQLCNCCGDVQMALANGFAGVEQGANARQIANMQQAFAAQTAMAQGFNGLGTQLADCCCENRLASADLKYTIATENCADRAALSDGIRDLLANQTANTQRILDQLCADKIDAKNDTIAQLRQELLFARGQASQDVQTAALRAGQATTANQLVSELRSCPIPAVPVYGDQRIFTCGGNGCGCGNNIGGFNGTF